MPATALDHINIRAPRETLDALRDFYCAALGLVVGERPPFASFGYWLYAGGQPVLHLSTASASEPDRRGLKGTLDHVAFACTDLAAMCRRLEEMGIAYSEAEVPQRGQRQLFFSDPVGNGVELNFSVD